MGTKNDSTVKLGDDGIIRATVIGDVNEALAKRLITEIEQDITKLRADDKKALLLVDQTRQGKTDAGAKQLAQEFFKRVKYDRIALFGANKENVEVVRYLLNTIIQTLHIKSFKTEVRALGWLKRAQTPPSIKARRILLAIAGLVVLAVLWHQFFAPRLLRLPDNFSYEASVVSYDNFYNEQTASYSGKALSDTKFTYTAAGNRDGALDIKNLFDVRTTSGEKVFAVERIYGIDKITMQHVPGRGDRDRQGYLFAPANLGNQDFTYWHVNYDEPALMKFQSEEDILGLKTHRYTTYYHADQTKDLTFLPGVGTTRGVNLDIDLRLWIEPSTGYLVKYEDYTTAYFYDLATGKRLHPWNQFSNSYGFDSVATHVQFAKQEKQRKDLIETGVPVIWTVTLLGLLVWCARLIFQNKRLQSNLKPTLPRIGAVIIGITALAVIAGWATNTQLLTSLHPSFSAMHALTAINFLIFSITIWLLSSEPSARKRLTARILLGVILGIQAIYFAYFFFGAEIGIQPILRALDLPPLNGVSPITAACFSLMAFGVLLSGLKTRAATIVSQILFLVVLGLAVFAVASYAFNLQNLYSIPWFRAMALHTAILFIILVVSVFWLHPDWPITERVRRTGKNVLLSLTVLVMLLAVTGVAWQQATSSATSRADLGFQAEANGLQAIITSELEGYIKALQGARGLFAASSEVERDEWKAYIDSLRLSQNYPGMQGLGFVQMVSPAQKAAHLAEIRSQGFPTYSIKPEGSRETYSSIIYLEPFDERNQRAFGYDMLTEPIRREAMERARDTGEATLSGKVTLLQEDNTDQQYGMLMYLPVYKSDAPLTSSEERQAALKGYVYMPIRMGNFMKATVGNQTHGLNIGVFDSSDRNNITLDNRLHVISKEYGIENTSYKPRFVRIETVNIANRNLTFRFSSLPSYDASDAGSLPSFVLFGGIALSVLLAALTFLLSSSRNRALKLAETMTVDLRNERNLAITNQRKDQAILSSIGDGVFVIDPSGKIILFNKAAELICGFTAAKAIGQQYQNILHFYHEKTGEPAHSFILSALKGTPAEMDQYTLLKRQDGSSLPVADSAAPVVDASGNLSGAVVVFRDISRERQLEKTKDEFLSIASHELRTPMGAIRANTAMMLEGDYGKVNKNLVEPITDVHTSAVRLVDLVNDMLNASRIEAGRMKFTLGNHDIQELLRQAIANLIPLGKEKGLKITLEPSKSRNVQVDPDKLVEVIVNLVGNALKFTNKGNITIAAHLQKDLVSISVSDTGIGIAAEEQTKLFGKFSQVSSQQAGKPIGTGLGLYISREIVRKMGGELWLDHSEPGKGSTFSLTVPSSGTLVAQKVRLILDQETKVHPDQK